MSDETSMKDRPLRGKVAVVTGSSRGLGRGIALVLAEDGADVVVNYHRSRDRADEVVGELEALGVRGLAVQADVSREADVARLFDAAHEAFGKVDILVNNAGTTQDKDIFEQSLEDWQSIIDTNLTSCFLCSKRAMSDMRDRGEGGRIVNISSIVGQRGAAYGRVHYAATKSGMMGVTKTLARAGASMGINVYTVAPGVIESELIHQAHTPESLAELCKEIPLGMGTARDVGLTTAFLCGEGGNYLTGVTIDVNGGMHLH